MRYESKLFQGQHVQLDGNEFVACQFVGCVLVFGATGPLTFVGNAVDRDTCRYEVLGPASDTLHFLTCLANEDEFARSLVLNTFNAGPQSPDAPRIWHYWPMSWDRTRPLYKYMKSEHADALLAKGQLRIGTLYDYRNMETYGTQVGDSAEGSRVVYCDDQLIDTDKPETFPPFVRDIAQRRLGITPGSHSTFEHCLFVQQQLATNRYVLSMCAEHREEILEEFGRENGYNACVRIRARLTLL